MGLGTILLPDIVVDQNIAAQGQIEAFVGPGTPNYAARIAVRQHCLMSLEALRIAECRDYLRSIGVLHEIKA